MITRKIPPRRQRAPQPRTGGAFLFRRFRHASAG